MTRMMAASLEKCQQRALTFQNLSNVSIMQTCILFYWFLSSKCVFYGVTITSYLYDNENGNSFIC
jgi:heme/copper-type cytochrome/quinol oxidase subunit 3